MIHPIVVSPILNPVVRVTDPVRWRAGRLAPDGAILHFDADLDAFAEQTGGVHKFNHAVLSPQYQRGADGSYSNVGAKPAVDVFGGQKWLRSCRAITNLFGGDTSQARSVSLTNGTVYTLHVFGAGTVSCSYGEATVAAPLKITATATGSVTFTPTGATHWMLTATSYPVPYVPPGVTQPVSNATTTNGSWFTLPDGSELWKALDGQADGVELSGGDLTGWSDGFNATHTANTITTTAAGTGITLGPLTIGSRYRIRVQGSATAGFTINSADAATPTARTELLANFGDVDFVAASGRQYAYLRLTNIGTATITSISIQRIQPQPLTLATRVRMGVGSGDLAVAAPFLNSQTVDVGDEQYMTATAVVKAYDKSNPVEKAGTFSRNAVIRRVTQVNTAGTQFRVGYMIEGTHTSIQWSAWVTFDGSFNPSTLYRLLLGYNNTYPMWFNKITAWRKQVSDAEILEAMAA